MGGSMSRQVGYYMVSTVLFAGVHSAFERLNESTARKGTDTMQTLGLQRGQHCGVGSRFVGVHSAVKRLNESTAWRH
jgi:hypothetical protein